LQNLCRARFSKLRHYDNTRSIAAVTRFTGTRRIHSG
jgi:hypothetical protein